MKSTIFFLVLLSLDPTPTLGEACGLCSGFDANLPIDLSFLTASANITTTESGKRTRRFLQESGFESDLTNCAQLKTAITLDPDPTSDNPNCDAYSLLAFSFCGCDEPPTDSCYTCPAGGTFDGDIVPDIPKEMTQGDGSFPVGTCSELAFAFSFSKLLIDAFADAFDEIADENTTATADVNFEDGMDLCAVVQSFCGCDAPESACKICENGVKNPDATIDGEDLTCGQGIKLIEFALVGVNSCDEGKKQANVAGCVCNTEVESSAFTNKNIATLLIISAATTMVAFLP